MASASDAAFADANLEFDCPVCYEPFQPPIYQCNNGHLLCSDCELQCQVCPVCRQSMPCRKIRSLTTEKIMASLANAPTPCPNQNIGCTAIVKKKDLDDHKMECDFVGRKFCSLLGLPCAEKHTASKMNKMITHLIFDHDLDGATGDNIDELSPSASQLQIVQNCTKSDLAKYLEPKELLQEKGKETLLKPNFIKFEDRLFFVKKTVNATEKVVSIMVCIDASFKTAAKYSALIQLFPGKSSVSVSYEFKQREVALLTDEFDTEEASHLKLCKIPFSTIEYYGKTDDMTSEDLSLKLHVSILKNLEPPLLRAQPKKRKSSKFSSTGSASESSSTKLGDPVTRADGPSPASAFSSPPRTNDSNGRATPGQDSQNRRQSQGQRQLPPYSRSPNSNSDASSDFSCVRCTIV